MITPHTFEDDGGGDCRHCPLPYAHPVHVRAEPPTPAEPLTPYAGTSGWSGSDTSRERAETEDDTGVTGARQRRVLRYLAAAGHDGATWKEVAQAEVWHHGQASGALSVLHKEGKVARLAQRRDRCEVYVLPDHVDGRETKPHGRKPRLTEDEERALSLVEAELAAPHTDLSGWAVETVAAALRRLA